jgi:hypothetical protein
VLCSALSRCLDSLASAGQVCLGRNLITVFSTVNNPGQENPWLTSHGNPARASGAVDQAASDARAARGVARPRSQKTSCFTRYSHYRHAARHRATRIAPRPARTLADDAMAANDGLRDGWRFRIATRPIARKCANRDDPTRMFGLRSASSRRRQRSTPRADTAACAGKKKPRPVFSVAGTSATQWSSSSSSSA